jgi:2-polyprenyl-3-methyl-5-hydroxy-6-metoxy-1,4-benzoquinol methylase
MPDFSKRSSEVEIMDDLNYSGEVLDVTLRELEFINLTLGGNHVTLNGLAKLLKNYNGEDSITILDLGCGGGDMLRIIDRWAKKRNIKVKLIGVDANPHTVELAKRYQQDLPHLNFIALDIFSEEFKTLQCDIVIATLFYHHFTNDQLINFFLDLKTQARLGFIINDIHRHPLAYYSIKYLTKWFSKSSMVKEDAALSVLRAFTKEELQEILSNAGLTKYTMKWKWAFRWQVIVWLR